MAGSKNGAVKKLTEKGKRFAMRQSYGTCDRRSAAEHNSQMVRLDCAGNTSPAQIEALTKIEESDARRLKAGKRPASRNIDMLLKARVSELNTNGVPRVCGVKAIPFTPKQRKKR